MWRPDDGSILKRCGHSEVRADSVRRAAPVLAGVGVGPRCDAGRDDAYGCRGRFRQRRRRCVSVLRADVADDPVSPPQGSDVSYRISTFTPQATEAACELTEHFGVRPGDPGSPIGVENILDTEVLRRAATFAVIARVFAMWAGHRDSQGLWSKGVHYRQLFEKARQRCRLSIDLGSDGVPDIVRIGGAIKLVRD